ncbi:MAG: DNA polymerase III subunit gamma/tau [Flavobacteriaceae bacterium]|nr:DNA polymerase III subunit gamma/tau [Flavobacteriaceae bacterium]
MEHFVVSARKYRPVDFEDVVGQKAITQTLLNAIARNHLAQALLFTGPRGVGKTTCARILAKKINTTAQTLPEEDFAFNIFELDAASNNSVDDIRNLIDQVRIPPQTGKYKVYIIDEVHMLSQSAFNAFLKTLEEPPAHAIFILATTEKHKILPTILSRCQIFDFKRITVKDTKEHLAHIAKQEGVEAEDDALHIIAQKADGALRDALSTFDRVVTFCGKKLTRKAVADNLSVLDFEVFFDVTDAILQSDIPKLLMQFDAVLANGFDGQHFLSGLAAHLRDLMVAKNNQTLALLEVGEDMRDRYLNQSRNYDGVFLINALDEVNQTLIQYKQSIHQRLSVELLLMKLAQTFDKTEKKNPIVNQETERKAQPIQPAKPNDNHPMPSPDGLENSTEHTKPEAESVLEPEVQIKQVSTKTPQAKRVSALSVKSIDFQKKVNEEAQAQKKEMVEMPQKPFTEQALQEKWISLAEHLKSKGSFNIASILLCNKPSLKNGEIVFAFPNKTMENDFQANKAEIVGYLSEKLENYDLKFHFLIDETAPSQRAYTQKEKLELLMRDNAAILDLIKSLELDI